MNTLYLQTDGDTIINLPDRLEIEGYICGVAEFSGKLDKNGGRPYYLCSNMTQDVYVNDTKLPVLRQITVKANGFVNTGIDKMIWLKVTRRSVSSIHLYICDEKGEICSFKGKGLYCTLLLMPDRYG